MRILIDECLNWRLSRALTGHYAVSAQKMGWGGIKNGTLLALAEKEFAVFITGDRNLSFQQAVTKLNIAVIVLHATSTQLHRTLLLMPKVLAALPTIKPGQVANVYPKDRGSKRTQGIQRLEPTGSKYTSKRFDINTV